MQYKSHPTMTPLDYGKIFFRRKWLIIIPTFIGLILGICAGILTPKQYTSSTIILVEESKTDNPLFKEIAISTTVGQRIAAIRESILGWNSLVELIKRLHLDADVNSAPEFEGLVLDLRNTIKIQLRGQNIIDLSYVGNNPELTQAVVKNITDIFIEKNVDIQNQETSDAIKFIEEQLEVYRGKIKSAEIAELQDQLDDLLIDSTEKHPLVKELREKINQKRQELEDENLEYTESNKLVHQTTNPIIAEIKSALDAIKPGDIESGAQSPDDELYKTILIDKLDTVMARDVAVNERVYNMLLQRLETAKITQHLQSSKEGTRYTILDPPRVPYAPSWPNRPLIALIGLFVGFFLGFGAVVGTEFLDKSFLDVQEAKEFLGEPLLGAISKISTPEGTKSESERQRWIATVTVAIGIALIVLTVIISYFFE